MDGSPPNPRNGKKHHSQIPVSQSPQLPLPIKSLHQGLVVAGRFKLLEKIGQGSFGSIFKTENLETGDICATKFEKREDNQGGISLLVREIKVLMEIKGSYGFPQISFYGRDEHYNYFMVNYLGYNFESLMRKCGGKFSIMSTLQLASQMMNRIEVFHSKNLIHRDIKPENFVIGNNDISTLHLIDFGLSKYYKDTQGKHIPWVEKKGIIGTARYASINAHQGNEQSRRDDLEGIGYVLVYFARGKLPWMNIQTDVKHEKYNKIMDSKMQTTVEVLCEGLPKCFVAYFQHVRALSFTEGPNYVSLKALFQQAIAEQEKLDKFLGFDWERLPEFKSKVKQSKVKDQGEKQSMQLKQQSTSRSPTRKECESPVMGRIDHIDEGKRDRKPQIKKLTLLNPNEVRHKSFLMVPLIKEESNSKGQKSIADSRAISIDTSRCNNYDMSNMNVIGLMKDMKDEKESPTKFLHPMKSGIKRKETKALTISNPKGGSFFREAVVSTPQHLQQLVDEDYADFDNIHEFADDDDAHLNVANFMIKSSKRIK